MEKIRYYVINLMVILDGPDGCVTTSYIYNAVQSLKAVTAYFSSKQLLPFSFAKQYRHDLGRRHFVNKKHVP